MNNLIGQKFGRLIVIQRMDNNKWGNLYWLCKCDCGNEKIVRGSSLQSSNTQSCGCFKIEKATKHGYKRTGQVTGIYISWCNMIQRCTNPNDKNYHNYGGRKIKVCKRWMKFENFLEDMIKGWKPGLTIERIDNKLGYYPGNCEWIIKAKQQRNKQNSLYVTYKEKHRLFIELCEEHNMPYYVVYGRYYRYGWTLKEALTTPVGKRRKNEQ